MLIYFTDSSVYCACISEEHKETFKSFCSDKNCEYCFINLYFSDAPESNDTIKEKTVKEGEIIFLAKEEPY